MALQLGNPSLLLLLQRLLLLQPLLLGCCWVKVD
jgi:hypothetical protein